MCHLKHPVSAPVPPNEVERLAVLRSYCVLDTPPEPMFDHLTRLAATMFNVPIVLISLIDECRQFFKSAVGLSVSETSRDISFCSYTLLSDQPLIVLDAQEDARFQGNPLVTGEPHIRFYGGVSILVGGVKFGSFCVIDRSPRRHFTADEILTLQRFASIASEQIEMRLLPQALKRIREEKITLQNEADQERAASKAKTEFLSNMSHEIRTPMNGVLGMIQLLSTTSLTPEQQHYAEVAENSSKVLLSLIDDLLDISKIEAGKILIESMPFSLRRLLGNVNDLWKVQAKARGLKYELHIDGGLQDQYIGDPHRLRQVLSNLLSNAIKFTVVGGVTLDVRSVDQQPEHVTLRFAVIDSGMGIKNDTLRGLFQPFVQADASTTRKFGGSGLGLVICKKLIELMGGTISIDSEEGKGSTFWFTVALKRGEHRDLPRDGVNEAHNIIATLPALTVGAEVADSFPEITSPQILIVEDNRINLMVIEAQLSKLGYHAAIACNGQEAVDAVCMGEFQLVLMDCEMPVMDGYRATKRIRELGYGGLQIIALTAHAMAGNRERCLEAGMNYYLSKPLDLQILGRILKERCPELRISQARGQQKVEAVPASN